jgi:hypothetical protein
MVTTRDEAISLFDTFGSTVHSLASTFSPKVDHFPTAEGNMKSSRQQLAEPS